MGWRLNVDGVAAKECDSLGQVYELLNNAYLALGDQYGGILRWELRFDGADSLRESMAAAIWHANCFSVVAFEGWVLNIRNYKKEVLNASLNDGWLPDSIAVD